MHRVSIGAFGLINCPIQTVHFLSFEWKLNRYCWKIMFVCLFNGGVVVLHTCLTNQIHICRVPRGTNTPSTIRGCIMECRLSPIQWRIWTGLIFLFVSDPKNRGKASRTEDCYCALWAAWQNFPITLRVAIILRPWLPSLCSAHQYFFVFIVLCLEQNCVLCLDGFQAFHACIKKNARGRTRKMEWPFLFNF